MIPVAEETVAVSGGASALLNPVFIGGAPRSGLTLLRMILDAHPQLTCLPDAGFMPGLALQWRDIEKTLGSNLEETYGVSREALRGSFRRAMEGLLAPALVKTGKPRLVEKSAMNAVAMDTLGELFPDAMLVLLIRDGRDVVASLLDRDWKDPRSGEPFAYTQHAGTAASYWLQLVNLALEAKSRLDRPDRVYILRYEDLVKSPEQTLRALFSHINVSWDEGVLEFYRSRRPLVGMEYDSWARLRRPLSPRSIGRWKRDLSVDQRAQVKSVLGVALVELGYTADLSW